MEFIKTRIQESIDLKLRLLYDEILLSAIKRNSDVMTESLRNDGKILFCRNGGLVFDSLHFTGEPVGRFQKECKGMAAVSLNTDAATMTVIDNDYGYDEVFGKSVEGLMKPEDVLIGISTGDNSSNVYNAVLGAKGTGATYYDRTYNL